MKKKTLNQKILYSCSIIIFIIVIIILANNLVKIYNNSKINKSIKDEREKMADSVVFKEYVLEKDDGWYYFISNSRFEGEDNEYKYGSRIDGCNIKYFSLEDNYGEYIDETNPKNNYHIPSFPPGLATSHKSKNGQKTEADELKEINNLLKTNWQSKITADDLSSIDFVNFDKEDIINLWNEVYDMKYTNKIGNYSSLGECSLKKEDKEENYFQVGVVFNYGSIAKIRIDYYYGGNVYLTDLIKNKTASKEEIELYKNIQNIEKEILENNSFNLGEYFDDLKKDSKYNSLFAIIENLESYKDK